MKKSVCIIALLLIPGRSAAEELISSKTDSLIKLGIRLGIELSFDEAIAVFSNLQEGLPNNPVGFFFHAAVLQLQMMDYEIYDQEQQFLTLIDQTLERARAYIRRASHDAWGYFMLGSAYGYRAFYQAKKNKYVDSLQDGRRSVKALETALKKDPSLSDAYLALGNYKYYRSKISRHLAWLPFVDDERKEAIAMLKRVVEKSRYSKYSAMNSFCWIALEEENYEEGWQMVSLALEEFPDSRVFLWCAAKLAAKLENWQTSADYYQKILSSLKEKGMLSVYNELICRKNLFHIYREVQEEELALMQCQRIEDIKRANRGLERSAKILDEIVDACGDFSGDNLIGRRSN